MRALWLLLAVPGLGFGQALDQGQIGALRLNDQALDAARCVPSAADFHQVNPMVLAAILKVESSFNPKAVGRNTNGTVDVGIGQMNSMHFKELASYGIAPAQLMDACVGTYVAAWHLSKQLRSYGNTWFAVGAYHSRTPAFNNRYQVLVWNALIDLGAISGKKSPVPALAR